MNPVSTLIQKVSLYIRSKITRPQYITLIAVATGLVAGLIAVLLKTAVHYLQQLFSYGDWYYFLLPAIGLLITVLIIHFFYRDIIEKGIGMVLKAIARKSSFIPTSNTFKHVITSTTTVGFGGSAGLEAPIVATGSSFGSWFGRITDLNYSERTLMLACGAAAGIAAVFNAPIAGVIFAIEVLLTEALVSHFIPLMIASAAGVLCSKIILKEDILFNFILQEEFNYRNVPHYILLGVLCGFASLYYAKAFKSFEKKIHDMKLNRYLKAVVSGLILAGLIYIFPPLFGEGYNSVSSLANLRIENVISSNFFNITDNDFILLLFLGLIMLLKPIAVAITLGGGGNGGNFAPSLFVGSYLGYLISKLLNITGLMKVPEGNFSLVGMAGVLSGVMYCPLTAMFLIAEITNGYGLFVPLMIVSALSFFIVKHFEPYSMELKKLVKEGEVFTHKKEQNILTSITLKSILSDKYQSININKTMHDLVEMIKKSDNNIFAVVDDQGRLSGVIELNDIKKELFDKEQYHKLTIMGIMKKPRATLMENEPMNKVMEKMDATQTWYLPVLNEDKKFISFVSKTKLFARYREILSEQSDLYED